MSLMIASRCRALESIRLAVRVCGRAGSFLEVAEQLRLVAQLGVYGLEQPEAGPALLGVVPRGDEAQTASNQLRGLLPVGARTTKRLCVLGIQPNGGRNSA